MSNTTVGTDPFWEADLALIEKGMGVNLSELMLNANAAQGGGIKRAEEIVRILGR